MKQNISMYETLLELPLFKGVSHERISEIIGKTRFEFKKFMPNEVILHSGQNCTHLTFVLSGEVRISISDASKSFSVRQTVTGPDCLLPDFLFGRSTSFPGEATALSSVRVLKIDKVDYLKILTIDPVFLLNYLNYLSMNAQKPIEGLLAGSITDLAKRIALLIVSTTQSTAQNIVVKCIGPDLFTSLRFDRNSLLNALEEMKKENLIDFNDNSITVLDRRGLQQMLYGISAQ